MTEAERNLRFKQRLTQGGALLLPGASNALAARIAQDCGYEALYISGAGVTNTNLGLPDMGLISLPELIDVIIAVRQVCDLPLVVDGDTGFGNAMNVRHTVRRIEAAGGNAIQLEDQEFPKRCGHFDGKEVIPAAEMATKIRAACDARLDPNFQIMARTDAAATEGFEAAIERAKLYVEAGADIIFVEALTSAEHIKAAPALIDRPLLMNVVLGGKSPALPLSTLDESGYKLVLYANLALQASMHAMHSALGDLKANGAVTDDSRIATFSERQRLVGKPEFDALDQKYKAEA